MKVTSSTSTSASSATRAARPATGGGFSVPAGGVEEATTASGVAGAGAVASLEALIALQSVEGPLERRRRAVGRASKLLDLLDEVKLGLLDGALPAASLERLSRTVREEKVGVEDGKLQDLLGEIETRAAVELAKLDQAGRKSAAV